MFCGTYIKYFAKTSKYVSARINYSIKNNKKRTRSKHNALYESNKDKKFVFIEKDFKLCFCETI